MTNFNDKTRLTGFLALRKHLAIPRCFVVGRLKRLEEAEEDYLAAFTTASKAFGSFTASSAKTLRSKSILAVLRPAISLE